MVCSGIDRGLAVTDGSRGGGDLWVVCFDGARWLVVREIIGGDDWWWCMVNEL